MVAPEPFSLLQILSQEFEVLRPDAGLNADEERTLFREVHQQEAPLTALCLSGGGIRSATFGLGVIQGLAEQGMLGAFDYLSTVSGGGYIGGWLTAWKQHMDGIEHVIPRLFQNAAAVPEAVSTRSSTCANTTTIFHQTWLVFSGIWTLFATIPQHVPELAGVCAPADGRLMAPRLLLSLARLGETYFAFYSDSAMLIPQCSRRSFLASADSSSPWRFSICCGTCPGWAGKHTEVEFLKYCLVPLIGATVAFIINDSWFTGGDLTRPAQIRPGIGYWTLTRGVMASAFAGWIVYLSFAGKAFGTAPVSARSPRRCC